MTRHDLRDKALGHSRYVCLNDDGMWLRFVWQGVTDRRDSVKSGNDQWIGRERSTKLKALWVQLAPSSELEMGVKVQMDWDPAL